MTEKGEILYIITDAQIKKIAEILGEIPAKFAITGIDILRSLPVKNSTNEDQDTIN